MNSREQQSDEASPHSRRTLAILFGTTLLVALVIGILAFTHPREVAFELNVAVHELALVSGGPLEVVGMDARALSVSGEGSVRMAAVRVDHLQRDPRQPLIVTSQDSGFTFSVEPASTDAGAEEELIRVSSIQTASETTLRMTTAESLLGELTMVFEEGPPLIHVDTNGRVLMSCNACALEGMPASDVRSRRVLVELARSGMQINVTQLPAHVAVFSVAGVTLLTEELSIRALSFDTARAGSISSTLISGELEVGDGQTHELTRGTHVKFSSLRAAKIVRMEIADDHLVVHVRGFAGDIEVGEPGRSLKPSRLVQLREGEFFAIFLVSVVACLSLLFAVLTRLRILPKD